MSAKPPEANTEYSRATGASGQLPGARSASHGPTSRSARAALGTARTGVLAAGLLGAIALVVAELMPLLHVRVAGSSEPIKTVLTGAHHGYALAPIAALSAMLTIAALRHASRPALIALGGLGVVALVIAVAGDLPAARATGLVGSSAARYVQARSSAAVGLYLETLGAVLLLLASGLGLLVIGPGEARQTAARGSDPDIDHDVERNKRGSR